MRGWLRYLAFMVAVFVPLFVLAALTDHWIDSVLALIAGYQISDWGQKLAGWKR